MILDGDNGDGSVSENPNSQDSHKPITHVTAKPKFSETFQNHFFGHCALVYPGDKQCMHLCTRFTLPLHSLPGLRPVQAPWSFAQEKQISLPVWSFP
jgi:hypothetical protein